MTTATYASVLYDDKEKRFKPCIICNGKMHVHTKDKTFQTEHDAFTFALKTVKQIKSAAEHQLQSLGYKESV